MGLNIDTTIALRTPGQLANLVNAILAADPVDETHWLEWKTDVNLTDRQWQARIAKFVLGVANRRPQVADPACEGCAYMALGVAPGKLSGCVLPDSAQLDDGFRRFLGADGPQYSVNSVVVSGTSVVVVTVERTPPGRRPYIAQREYSDAQGQILRSAGIYIRRSGKTTEADVAEVKEMLAAARSEAAGAGPGWNLLVEPSVVKELVAVDATEAAIDAWVAAEREDLTRGLLGRGTSFSNIFALAGESRSRNQFYDEVDAYVDRARPVLPNELMVHLESAKLSRVALKAENWDDNSLPGLVLELELPDGFNALGLFRDLGHSQRIPARPRRYGHPDLISIGPIGLPPPTHSGVHVRADQRGRYAEFPPIVVPQRRSTLSDWITLLVPANVAGQSVTLRWWAHSPDRRGEAAGEVTFPVPNRVLSVAEVMALEPVID